MQQQQMLNRLQSQVESQTLENAQIRRDLAMLEINSEVNIQSLKADMQEIRTFAEQLKHVHEVTDLSELKRFDDLKFLSFKQRLDQIEQEVTKTMSGHHIGAISDRVLSSYQFQTMVGSILKDKAISVCDSRLGQFQVLYNKKLGAVGTDCFNLAQSHRNLENQLQTCVDKMHIIEDQMGFIEKYKNETTAYLNRIWSEHQTQVNTSVKSMENDLHQVQYNLVSIQNLKMEERIKEFSHHLDNMARNFREYILENDSRVQNLTEQTKIEIESNLRDMFCDSPSTRMARGRSPSKIDIFESRKTTTPNNFFTTKPINPNDSKLNFIVNAEQIERFLLEELRHQPAKMEIEKAYYFEDCFSLMLQRVTELKSLFKKCQKEMQQHIREYREGANVDYQKSQGMLPMRSVVNHSRSKKYQRPVSQIPSTRVHFENFDISTAEKKRNK